MGVYGLLVALSIGGAERLAAATEGTRLYEDGPLTAQDFQATVPPDVAGDAFTGTQLRYDFQYRYQGRDGRVTATVTEVTVEALVRQDQSWNRRPSDPRLLEHEQGHADNAWIQCLKARLAFDQKRRRGWTASAPTLAEASEKLSRELTDKLMGFEEEGRAADARYDEETKHGLGPQQAEWRRVQKATIQELETEWERRARPAASRRSRSVGQP